MRKTTTAALIATLLVPTIALPTAASANTTRREIRQDVRHVREEKHELRHARRTGTIADIRDERRDLHRARKELHEDRHDFRAEHKR